MYKGGDNVVKGNIEFYVCIGIKAADAYFPPEEDFRHHSKCKIPSGEFHRSHDYRFNKDSTSLSIICNSKSISRRVLVASHFLIITYRLKFNEERNEKLR